MALSKISLVLSIAICTVAARDSYLSKRDEMVGTGIRAASIASGGLVKRDEIVEQATHAAGSLTKRCKIPKGGKHSKRGRGGSPCPCSNESGSDGHSSEGSRRVHRGDYRGKGGEYSSSSSYNAEYGNSVGGNGRSGSSGLAGYDAEMDISESARQSSGSIVSGGSRGGYGNSGSSYDSVSGYSGGNGRSGSSGLTGYDAEMDISASARRSSGNIVSGGSRGGYGNSGSSCDSGSGYLKSSSSYVQGENGGSGCSCEN